MAFKMNNPMKKNFGSALNITEAQEKNLNPGLVAAIKKSEGDSPKEMKKDNAPMMRMEKGAMKKMGSPKKIDLKFSGGQDAKKERESTAKREFLENYKKMTPEEQAKIPKPVKEAYGV